MRKKYHIEGIDCANCAAKVEKKMNELPDVEVTLTFATSQLMVDAENPDEVLIELRKIADKMEPGTVIEEISKTRKHGGKKKSHHHDDDCCDDDCCHGKHDGHEHHHHHHADEVFTSWGKETPHKFTKEKIEDVLKTLCETDDYGTILRAKGMVEDENGTWIYFDMVPGEYELRDGEPDYTGRLCVIGCNIDEHRLEELFGI